MASQNDSDVFSVRIVSLDYYMSPPIPNLDHCYSSFHGTKVEEIPVIRVFGATPSGQKTCLHVHRALPYFYIPFPDDLLQSSEEGHAFIYTLFNAIEKALRHKPTSKRQHVHGCTLVRAKKLYGYHSSEEVFVKIILYYPHDVPRAASFLLDGSILGKSFQPFESHIPYLLQFLVDYNLYGMSHLHASKVTFRSPLTYCYNSTALGRKNYDVPHQAIPSCYPCGKPKFWISSTVPSSLLWPDSTASLDSTENKDFHLTRRQSICQLEADASVEDIINEKFKINTSLSQTRFDVRMVQSLVPIWEEEYERTGVQQAVNKDDPNKPHPDNVLRSFLDGVDYDKALSDLCSETCNFFPTRIHEIDGDDKLAQYMNSFSDISLKVELVGRQQCSNFFDVHLLGDKEDDRSKETSSKSLRCDPMSMDTEPFRLISWLASFQAKEEVDAGDELLGEAILGSLFPGKPYSVGLEIAHRDYENASQLECQDILDSVEDILKPDRSIEQASSSSQDLIIDSVEGIAKYDRSEEQDLSSSRNILDDVTSGSIIPQVDGSFNENLETRKGNTSETNVTYGGENAAAEPGRMGPKICCRSKENKFWGTLPFSVNQSKHEAYETLSPVSSPGCEMINVNSFNPPFHNKEGDRYDASKNESSVENCSEKYRKSISSFSVRDLMRKKRCLRVEQADTHFQKNEDMTPGQMEELTPVTGKKSLFFPVEDPSVGFSVTHQNVQGNIACSTNTMNFNKENSSEGFCELTFINRPLSNVHIHIPEVSSPVGQTDVDIDNNQGMENIMPFFPRVSQDVNLHGENVVLSQDLALGIPTHFQNDGSVLYLLTCVPSPPTLNTVYDWLSGGKQDYVLNARGASKEGFNTYNDGVLNEGASCCKISPSSIHCPLRDSSQSNGEKCSPETEHFHAKEKIITYDLHDLSQLSGVEKYENLNPTPLSQIGFRDPACVGFGQQLTLISMELQAESRGDLRPDPKFDAINVLSLVVQEDTNEMCQIFVLLRVEDEKVDKKNRNGAFDCKLFFFTEEKLLLEQFVEVISYFDPDILMGWEIQRSSLGYLAERASYFGMKLLEKISRTPFHQKKENTKDTGFTLSSDVLPEVTVAGTVPEGSIFEDEWGRNHASGLHVSGRIVLNIWRLMRAELKLNMYTAEAVAEEVLRRKIPLFPNRVLNQWYSSGMERARNKCIEYVISRSMLTIQIMGQLDMINRTSELSRIFGIDFFSVISRGSQYRVESMLLRLAHTQNYLAISPGYQQVALQPAMECLPLVMEPESGFYLDPVVVLDFQSLYPSMIIAYNLCFCTCLGKVIPSRENVLGVSSYSPNVQILNDFRKKLLLTPNGVMYIPAEVRKGILPRLLEEILSTRIMVKESMKKLTSSQIVLHRILNARQLALKLIANVTYGYTAAGFSGRMPCAEIADSIVQCGRRTLETAISFVNQHEKWKAKVIYGDTDSMFVLLKGRSKEDAFVIGNEIASAITAMNPEPVKLKMEKVYQPCFLLTKKRYVGYSYESPRQEKPTFDAKGIETVRRDTCPAVAKILERSIRLFFESRDLSEVKSYLKRQWTRVLSGKTSLKDFIFAKEVRLGSYRASSLPPAAIVAKKAMEVDPRAVPHYGERVPYVVVHGEPGSRLMDMVVSPYELLDLNSPYRPNDLYYIKKQMIPALQRVFGLLGTDVNKWFSAIPRPNRPLLGKQTTHISHSRFVHGDYNDNPMVSKKPQAKRSRIDTYYSSKHCPVCGDLIESSDYFCVKCSKKEPLLAATMIGITSKKEKEMQHLAEICKHCGGGDCFVECDVKCTSLACSVFYERRKVQKELKALYSFATQAGFYSPCNEELF